MVTIGEAINYPIQRDEWYRTIIIGGVLSFFSFLIIPLFLVYGYIIRVIQSSLREESTPPVFEDWVELLIVGIKGWVIGIIYLLIPILVGALTIGTALIGFLTGTDIGAGIGVMTLLVGFFVSFFLFVLFAYVAVAAIVNFARTEQFADAFDIATLRPIWTDSRYAIAWVLSVILLLVAGVIAGALNVIPMLGTVVAAFVYFYFQMAAARLWADGFDRSWRGIETDDRPSPAEMTA